MPYPTPEAAYEAFFDRFNAEDAVGWAQVMHYPHVRVSAGSGTSMLRETPEDYAANASWAQFKAQGWVRTEGVTPVRIHESGDKVHLAGGWTRYNAADEPIRSNRVTYIVTRIGGAWGIQARFGTDSFQPGEDTAPSENAAVDLVRQHLDSWDTGDLAGCAHNAHYPLIDVGVGLVNTYDKPADYQAALEAQQWSATSSHNVHAVQVGRTGVNVAVSATLADRRLEQAVFLVALRDDHWKIAARSRIPG